MKTIHNRKTPRIISRFDVSEKRRILNEHLTAREQIAVALNETLHRVNNANKFIKDLQILMWNTNGSFVQKSSSGHVSISKYGYQVSSIQPQKIEF